MTQYEILPLEDPFNQVLIQNARPADWVNPTPSGRYNLVVVGGGSAGLLAVVAAVGLGAKVALIEKNFLGGDCLNVGCVPSKAVIRTGRAAFDVRDAGRFGIDVPPGVTIDFHQAMTHMRRVRAELSPHDSATRFRDLGVDLFFGGGTFTGLDTIEVGGQTLTFSRALIATGSQPADLPIPGLAESGYLTTESVFNLTERPGRLAVIGGGPIGAELAQALQRLGSAVYILDIADHLLPREDVEAAELVQKSLQADGVTLILGAKTGRIETRTGQKIIFYEQGGRSGELAVDEILLAVGRRPNIEALGLEAAGVAYDQQGVKVNDRLQTSNGRIYAAGDVALKYQFTHVAGHSAAIVVQNALFPFPKRKFSDLVIPWVTYTDPEVAHVGLYAHEAAAQGIAFDNYSAPMNKNDRAMADGEPQGFVKVLTRKGKGEILGGTIVARHAGEMINEITLAMKHNLGLGSLSYLIHPYPTQAETISRAAGAYNKTRLTPFVQRLFSWWLARSR